MLYYLHDDAVILVLGYRASPSTSELIQDILKLDALANFCSVQHFLDNSEAIARSLLLDLAGIQDILREGGDIGLFITLVHKVFIYLLGTYIELIDWVIDLNVQNSNHLVIYCMSSFVYHHWGKGCTSNYRPWSYPF